MNTNNNFRLSRRAMLHQSTLGMGSIALASMMSDQKLISAPIAHRPARAKNIIFLFMSGGPGQTDTFDPKPLLQKLDGQPVPESIAVNVPKIPRSGVNSKLMASPFSFTKYGQSGIEVSELFPETGKMVDDLCVIRSMNHRIPVHGPSECIALTGTAVGDRPSMGAWMTYGLGNASQNLPGFVVFLSNTTGPAPQRAGWGPGFLPAQYQGTVVDSKKGVPFTAMPSGYTDKNRREQLDYIKWMNERNLAQHGADFELEARIASYELGFRMQASAPEAFDVSGENETTQKLYGMDQKHTAEFGKQCLMARRLVENGVRCIQLRNGGWDAHGSLEGNHIARSRATDKPIAGLLQDLKQRGLLDDTLVVWGGEFGRTPTTEGSATGAKRGRDHSPAGYSVWMAGGGVKGGQIIGATDDLGYVPVDRPFSPADLHATMLDALGLDQHQLTYDHKNRAEIPTVFGGEVIQEVFS
ncbi:DUF1501 domain-containing protein [Verrucomicrobiales bacterium]|nr:DUF1501 domain-containing protein [Verrucomicrobiales bacterium]MDC0259004.1 DUF1501 domain-containing protein [Verrucomicrobiales bacterium]